VLWWVVDNALLLYLLLGCALFAVAASWWMTRRQPLLVAAGVLAGLLLLVWLLTRLVVTDRGRIERNVREMAAAVGEDRPADVVKHLARDFSYFSYTKQSAEAEIRAAVRRQGLREVRVSTIDIKSLSRAEGKAEVEVKVWVYSTAVEAGAPFWCHAEFVLEDDDWRLRRLRVTHGFVNTNQEVHP
jgi:hypothetical protein